MVSVSVKITMTITICLKCNKEFRKRTQKHEYCGSVKYKFGCSYIHHKEWKKLHWHNVRKLKPQFIAKSKDRIKYLKQYYQQNKEKFAKNTKAYRTKNKDSLAVKSKEYNIRTKDRKKEYDKTYYKNNIDKIMEYTWRTKEHSDNYRLSKKFGISLEEYNTMLKKQHGVCAICTKEEVIKTKKGNFRKLAVDHDHITGKVRGLLCSNCNTSLGGFQDDIKTLEKALKYLKKHKNL